MNECILSAFEPGDMPSLAKLYTDSRVRQFLGGPVDEPTALERVEALSAVRRAFPAWVIRSTGSRQAMGIVELDGHHDGEDVEISYLLLPEFQGRGYGTDAVRKAIRIAFLSTGLQRLVAETQSVNLASVRLLARVGMTLEREVVRFGAQQSIYAIARSQ
jgi:ribosomal-protein-alanine N-acetyltransferase